MKLSERIASKAVEVGAINNQDAEIYAYSYQMLFMTVLLWVSSILIGILSRQFWGMMLFMAFFVPMRQYAGGIHVKSRWVCYIGTILIFFLVSVSAYLPIIKTMKTLAWLLLPVSAIALFTLAPQEDENKPASSNEYRHFKRMTRTVFVIECIILFTIYWIWPDSLYCYFALCGLHLCTILVLIKVLATRTRHT